MPRKCKICTHPDREEIDQAILNGMSLRDIAKRHGVSRSSVARHKSNHLSKMISQVEQIQEEICTENLLEQVRYLQYKTFSILEKAESVNDPRIELQAIGQGRGNIELLAKLSGNFQENSQQVNILIASPQWLTIRTLILQTLEPYPDARNALCDALTQVEQAASSIVSDA